PCSRPDRRTGLVDRAVEPLRDCPPDVQPPYTVEHPTDAASQPVHRAGTVVDGTATEVVVALLLLHRQLASLGNNHAARPVHAVAAPKESSVDGQVARAVEPAAEGEVEYAGRTGDIHLVADLGRPRPEDGAPRVQGRRHFDADR